MCEGWFTSPGIICLESILWAEGWHLQVPVSPASVRPVGCVGGREKTSKSVSLETGQLLGFTQAAVWWQN